MTKYKTDNSGTSRTAIQLKLLQERQTYFIPIN